MNTILIVDDSPILRSTIKTALEFSGYTVIGEAENTAEALSIFEKAKPF